MSEFAQGVLVGVCGSMAVQCVAAALFAWLVRGKIDRPSSPY